MNYNPQRVLAKIPFSWFPGRPSTIQGIDAGTLRRSSPQKLAAILSGKSDVDAAELLVNLGAAKAPKCLIAVGHERAASISGAAIRCGETDAVVRWLLDPALQEGFSARVLQGVAFASRCMLLAAMAFADADRTKAIVRASEQGGRSES
jgi:CTP:molybdopterin cytidylyltransferase MocA